MRCGALHQPDVFLRECAPSEWLAVTAGEASWIERPDDHATERAVSVCPPPVWKLDFSTAPDPFAAHVPRPALLESAPVVDGLARNLIGVRGAGDLSRPVGVSSLSVPVVE